MVKVDVSGVKRKHVRFIQKAQYALANQVLQDANLFVPKRTGHLRMASYITNGNTQIVWNTPYARRHYYEQMTNYTTPGTGSRWDLAAESKFSSQWARIAGRAMR